MSAPRLPLHIHYLQAHVMSLPVSVTTLAHITYQGPDFGRREAETLLAHLKLALDLGAFDEQPKTEDTTHGE